MSESAGSICPTSAGPGDNAAAAASAAAGSGKSGKSDIPGCKGLTCPATAAGVDTDAGVDGADATEAAAAAPKGEAKPPTGATALGGRDSAAKGDTNTEGTDGEAAKRG